MANKMQTGFTKAARIETQEAAKFNYHRRMREQEEKEELKQKVKERIAEETTPTKVEPNRVGKKSVK